MKRDGSHAVQHRVSEKDAVPGARGRPGALVQNRRARAERLRALSSMAAGLAHQLNNVLAAILVRTEILGFDTVDPKQHEHLDMLQVAAQEGAGIVKRLQEFARLGRGGRFEAVDVNRLVDEALEASAAHRGAAGEAAPWEVRVTRGAVPLVPGDPAALRDVLANLVTNAVEAMPEGGRLTIATALTGPAVTVRVSDTGSGIAPEAMARIFDPFFTTKHHRGGGLGLAIAEAIVARHDGDLAVESAPGAGTTFLVSLPRSRPPA